MSEKLRESLSALMDDEANELELERVLSRIEGDDSLRRTWSRYSLARSALRGEQVFAHSVDISANVRAALQQEAKPERQWAERLRRPVASFAVAASVAATVVIGGQQFAQLDPASGYEVDAAVATSATPVGLVNSLGATAIPASFGTQPVPVLEPATRTAYRELARQRMGRYMQEHAEHAALNSPQGLIPFARVPEIRE